jgi:hypothetical protein
MLRAGDSPSGLLEINRLSNMSAVGFTDKTDGKTVTFSDCAKGEISFDKVNGRRVTFDVIDTKFDGDGVKLAGRLVLPKGGGRTAIMVLIHGSETDSARDFYPLQRLLPAEGVGAFVYDKRGTGGSGGKYTQDFSLPPQQRRGQHGASREYPEGHPRYRRPQNRRRLPFEEFLHRPASSPAASCR